jgi:Ran GTPase-activating protein (RanGAP) involved in mRNA processing and transport
MVARLEDDYELMVTRKISGVLQRHTTAQKFKQDIEGFVTKFQASGKDANAEMDVTTVEAVKAAASSEHDHLPFMSRIDEIRPGDEDEEGTAKPMLHRVLDLNECFDAAIHRLKTTPPPAPEEDTGDVAEGEEAARSQPTASSARSASTASSVAPATKGPEALLGDLTALRAAMMESGPIFDGVIAHDMPWMGDTGTNMIIEAPAMAVGCGSSIVSLQLRNVNCTATGIAVLGQEAAIALTGLKVLDLGYNNIGNKGAITVSSLLKRVEKTLQYLSLDHCGIGKTGSKAVFGILSMRKIQLIACDMSYNKMGVGGTKMASEWLTHANELKQLGVAGTNLAMGSFLEALLNKGRNPKLAMETLAELDLSWNAPEGKAISAKSVRLLGELLSTSASIEFTKFSGLGLDHRTVKTLLTSAIGNQKFSDEFITERALILNHNELKGSKVPFSLLFECQPVIVDLSHCALGANGIVRLCNALLSTQNSSVTTLRISSNAALGAVSQGLLDKAGDAIAQLLQQKSKISTLEVAGDGLDYGLQSAVLPLLEATSGGNCPSLTSLDVSGNSCNKVANLVAKLIGAKTSIKTLRWDGNNTKPSGMQEVSAALESNTTLKSIEMPIQDILKLSKKSKTKAMQMVYWTQQMGRVLLAKGVKTLKPAVYDAPPAGTEQATQMKATQEFRAGE